LSGWLVGLHCRFGRGSRLQQQQSPFRRGKEEVDYKEREEKKSSDDRRL
jgi:hypothetical protein